MSRSERLATKLSSPPLPPFPEMDEWSTVGDGNWWGYMHINKTSDIPKLLLKKGCSPSKIQLIMDQIKEFAKFKATMQILYASTKSFRETIKTPSKFTTEQITDGTLYYYVSCFGYQML